MVSACLKSHGSVLTATVADGMLEVVVHLPMVNTAANLDAEFRADETELAIESSGVHGTVSQRCCE